MPANHCQLDFEGLNASKVIAYLRNKKLCKSMFFTDILLVYGRSKKIKMIKLYKTA